MSAAIGKVWPPFSHFLASLIGIGGVVLLFWTELQMSNLALQSLGFCLLGTLFFCTGNMVSQDSQRRGIPVFASTAWGMFYGTCYLGGISLIMGHEFIMEPNIRYLGSLAWLTVMSTVLTFSCYLSLIGRIGASRASYATVVFPVFALLISTVFENYEWTGLGMTGLSFVVIGNFSVR